VSASEQITAYIDGLPPWQRDLLGRMRQLIHDTDPEIVEEWKWDTPVFSHAGHVCAIGAFKDHVKINFFKGASLADPDGLFNAGLEAKTTRAIDLTVGDHVDEGALKRLITSAIERNLGTSRP
jgi:hypothetical protein